MAFCRGEIEREGALVRALDEIIDAEPGGVERIVRPTSARRVGHSGRLDLDHIGPKQGELIGAERARQDMGQVEHPDTVEGALR